MEGIIICIKLGVVFLGTLFTWIFGAWDMPIVTLLVFIFLDYLIKMGRNTCFYSKILTYRST